MMTNTLNAGQSLVINGTLNSNNGQYQLILQQDGNLVLYRLLDHHPLWATGTNGKSGHTATLMGDGTFVLYDASNHLLWTTGTNGKGGTHIIMQDDGNLVIYNSANVAVWASNTCQVSGSSSTFNAGQSLAIGGALNSDNGQYQLILQQDGNLVLYRLLDHHPLWATATNGKASATAIMQSDGNFVLYDANNHPLWATATNGKGGTHIIMQDDGNLVIYNPSNAPVWASNTDQIQNSIEVLKTWFPEEANNLSTYKDIITQHIANTTEPEASSPLHAVQYQAPQAPAQTATTTSEKVEAFGMVALDAILLGLGLLGINIPKDEKMAQDVIEEVGEEVLLGLEATIKELHEASGATEKAEALFKIVHQLFDAGGFKAVLQKAKDDLSWWEWTKIGVTSVLQITAWIATEGAGFIVEIAINILTAVDLIEDSAKAVELM